MENIVWNFRALKNQYRKAESYNFKLNKTSKFKITELFFYAVFQNHKRILHLNFYVPKNFVKKISKFSRLKFVRILNMYSKNHIKIQNHGIIFYAVFQNHKRILHLNFYVKKKCYWKYLIFPLKIDKNFQIPRRKIILWNYNFQPFDIDFFKARKL